MCKLLSFCILIYSVKQTDNSLSSDNFNKINSHLEKKLKVLQLQLNESNKSLSKHLEKKFLKYVKIESRACNMTDTKMTAVSQQEQLQITVDYLLENNQSSAKKYELLKTFVDLIAATKLKANRQQKNKTASVTAELSRPDSTEIKTSDDIYEEQEQLYQVINFLAEDSVSSEKFCELETLLDTLAGSSVTRDYIESALKYKAKERIKDLQNISTAVTNIDNKNTILEKRQAELKALMQKLTKANNSNLGLVEQEIAKQNIIIKAIQDENFMHKMKFERMMTEAKIDLNRGLYEGRIYTGKWT